MPLLPIGRQPPTIIYGSADGGESFHANDKHFNEVMRLMASELHIAGHMVGIGQASRELYAAGDIEGHKGYDGNYYLLDLARSFPPEDPNVCEHLSRDNPNAIFFRLLRPEYLRHFKTQYPHLPLSPDALSRWGGGHGSARHNANVAFATRELLNRVKAFATQLLAMPRTELIALAESDSLSFEMHSHGINVRHLGLLRAYLLGDDSANGLTTYLKEQEKEKEIRREKEIYNPNEGWLSKYSPSPTYSSSSFVDSSKENKYGSGDVKSPSSSSTTTSSSSTITAPAAPAVATSSSLSSASSSSSSSVGASGAGEKKSVEEKVDDIERRRMAEARTIASDMALMDMVGRTLKNLLRQLLR
jgi:hypothetical protein